MNAMQAFAAKSMLGGPPMLPQMPPHVSLPSASTSTPTTANNAGANNASSTVDDSRLSTSRSSRPRSRSPISSANTPSVKRPKNEPHEDADGELEIDVQNDDAGSMAGSLSAPHTNGTSQTGSLSRPPKDGRESAHSVSSRDSATPKSGTSKPVTILFRSINNNKHLVDHADRVVSFAKCGHECAPPKRRIGAIRAGRSTNAHVRSARPS